MEQQQMMDPNQQLVADNQPIDPQHPAMTTTGYALAGGEGLEEQGRDLNRSADPGARSRSRSRDAEENKDALPEAAKHSEKREGDWECPSCGKNVFAFKSTCFSCGTTKPGGVAGARPGDWECPSCYKNVFASRTACFNCGQPKPYQARGTYAPPVNQYTGPIETPEGGKPGDWSCPACNEHCFASRNSCRKCGQAKPGTQPPAAPQQHSSPAGGGGAWGGQGGIPGQLPPDSKAGDWMCPNQQCNEHCFASRNQCRKCGSSKPGMQQQGGYGQQQGMWGGQQQQGGYGYPQQGYGGAPMANYGYAQGYGGMPGGGIPGQLPPDSKAGDWMCPNPQCNEHCFASRHQCRKCGSQKPGGMGGYGGYGQQQGGYGGGGPPAHNPMMDERNKPGDWMCPNPNCRDLCFASRAECRKCGTAKPEGGAAVVVGDPNMAGGYGAAQAGGYGAPGGYGPGGMHQGKPGDWVCPNPSCRDLVFASKTACRKCGTTKP